MFCDKENISIITREWISSIFKKRKLYFGWMPPHTSLFVRNDILKSNLYEENYPISGDYLFLLKLLYNQNIKIKYLNNFITIMRNGGDSTKLRNFIKKLNEDLKIAKKFFKFPYFVVLMKIILKVNQLKLFKKNLSSDYIDILKEQD